MDTRRAEVDDLALAVATAARRPGKGTTLESLLDTGDPRRWVALDLGVRRLPWYWSTALPSMAWLRTGEPPTGEPVLAIALCHPDGRIRQAALERAAGVPALLPLVAVRCSDWAGPVRDLARALLRAGLAGAAPRTVALVTAVALRTAARRHGAHAHDLLMEILEHADAEVTDTLLDSRDPATRRLGYRIAVRRNRFSPARLARIAATDADVVVQDVCADAVLAHTKDGLHGELLEPLLRARASRVRSSGVTALHRTGRSAEATEFLTDRAGIVRACARWVLRQRGTDPLPLYRELCAGPSADVPPGAAAGLGECGTREDAALLHPLVAHPVARVRTQAVAALRALGTVDAERLRPLLDDPSAAVTREVATALVSSGGRLPEPWLWERLASGRPRHVRAAAFRLLAAQDGIFQLRCCLTLLDDADHRIREQARAAVLRWTPAYASTAYTALPADERARLDALVDRAVPVLGEHNVRLLRLYLGAGRP
ncbi:HEAT repeat domain-containing protein [Streptomyces sp. NPDC001678]|uniref:HEAT repeat domain-containing protein n=1 Tax=Streptomyces sp. NPDC001678 TaxID=3364599 RepID=UPI0036AEC7FC